MVKRLAVFGLLSALVLAPLAMGCGTIMGKAGLQDIKIDLNASDPAITDDVIKNATVFVNDVKVGNGPGVYKVDSRKNGNPIRIETMINGRKVTGAGNATRDIMPFVVVADAFMLIFPIYIDYADGGMYALPEQKTINLGIAPDATASQPDFPNGRSNAVNNFQNPPATGTSTPTNTDAKPCPFCGELWPANEPNCPHCGQHR